MHSKGGTEDVEGGYTVEKIGRMVFQMALCINNLEGAVIALRGGVELDDKAEDFYRRRLEDSQNSMRALVDIMTDERIS